MVLGDRGEEGGAGGMVGKRKQGGRGQVNGVGRGDTHGWGGQRKG